MKTTGRWLIAAVTIGAWIAISNHCAIAAATARAQEKQSGCPFHSKPAKPQSPPIGSECCKVLRAIASTPLKNGAPAIVDPLQIDCGFTEPVVAPKVFFAPATLDTGPPGKTSFADLTGSVRANAPPSFV